MIPCCEKRAQRLCPVDESTGPCENYPSIVRRSTSTCGPGLNWWWRRTVIHWLPASLFLSSSSLLLLLSPSLTFGSIIIIIIIIYLFCLREKKVGNRRLTFFASSFLFIPYVCLLVMCADTRRDLRPGSSFHAACIWFTREREEREMITRKQMKRNSRSKRLRSNGRPVVISCVK